ncbi:MAG: hypothetical protein P8074_26045 [Anaerolineales bacterium]
MMKFNKKRSSAVFATMAIFLVLVMTFQALAPVLNAAAAPQETGADFAETVTNTLYLPYVNNYAPLQTPFGVEMGSITPSGGLVEMVEAGVSWVRRNGLLWSQVEPTPGARDWSAAAGLETELKNASDNGLEAILIVRSTPPWAQKVAGSYCGPISADDFSAFGDFMYDVVSRYSKSPYNVKYYEIYNEPDIEVVPQESIYGCWGDASDPFFGGGYYGEMLKVVYPRIKAANPNAQVLTGGLLLDCDPINVCTGDKAVPPKFLRGMLAAGAGYSFDGVSFHAYDYGNSGLGVYSNDGWGNHGPVLVKKASYIRSILQDYGFGPNDKYLMNTEVALLKLSSTCDTTCQLNKAYYGAEAYAAGIATGLQANVWYDVNGGWRNTNLLSPSLTPFPVYDTLRAAHNELRDAQFVREVNLDANVRIYEFDRGDRLIWTVWSLDGSSHSLTLPGTPAAIKDVYGVSQARVNPITASVEPMYLEWYK